MHAAKKNVLSEKEIQNLELKIPAIAASATHAAYFRALACGRTVIEIEGANIVATRPDGSQEIVAPAKPKRKVVMGKILKVHC